MLHEWYFKDTNPIFEYEGISFAFSIFTDTNRYDVDPEKVEVSKSSNSFILHASGLTSGGGQVLETGELNAKITFVDGKYLFDVSAKKDEDIHSVKVILYNQPIGEVVARRRYNSTTKEEGEIFRYPNGWDDLYTPLVVIKSHHSSRYYRSLDDVVRPKTFCIRKIEDKSLVELIFTEDARHFSNEIKSPTWEVGDVDKPEEIYEIQRQYIEKAYGLVRWEDRNDVPEWAKNISLVISLHGMHWSGHIFNTYKQMEEKLDFIAKFFDPKDVCVYIPGFDGRYYYKYPNYDPDERMGGADGFKHLVDYAHKLGYHIMPMFMSNGAHPKTPGFDEWGEPSRYRGQNGFKNGVGSCDWDSSRGYNLGCGVGLNPGAPKWQDYIVKEINKQIDAFNFDAIFLDLAAIYVNDPVYSTHQGVVDLCNRIHEKHPEILISTEGCYDALSTVFPFSQCAGQQDRGLEMVYHDTPYAPIFDTYNRMYGHLCLGDLKNGYNGVFESGKNYAERTLPVRKGIIQTITIVDDSIYDSVDEIKEVVKKTNEYKSLFLQKKGGKR